MTRFKSYMMTEVTPEYKDLIERCKQHLTDLRDHQGQPLSSLRIKESETVLPFINGHLVEDHIEEIRTGRVR